MPVSKEVVSLAVFCIRATFSGEAASSYNTVPSLMSRILGLRKGNERFSRTMDCGYKKKKVVSKIGENLRKKEKGQDTYLFLP